MKNKGLIIKANKKRYIYYIKVIQITIYMSNINIKIIILYVNKIIYFAYNNSASYMLAICSKGIDF